MEAVKVLHWIATVLILQVGHLTELWRFSFNRTFQKLLHKIAFMIFLKMPYIFKLMKILFHFKNFTYSWLCLSNNCTADELPSNCTTYFNLDTFIKWLLLWGHFWFLITLIDYLIWSCFALITYLGDCNLGDQGKAAPIPIVY